MISNFIRRYLKWIIIAVIVFSFRKSFFDWYTVPAISMQPTLQTGNTYSSNELAYGLKLPFSNIWVWGPHLPKRGDIIVFLYPRDNKTYYVKRVIGLPGDRIRFTEDGELFVNDVTAKIAETQGPPGFLNVTEKLDKALYQVHISTNSSLGYATFTVPPAHLFVLGDNRDRSADSRTWGYLPIKNLEGRILTD